MHKKRQCLARLNKAQITSGVPPAKVQNSQFAAANNRQRHRYVTAPIANYRNCRLGFKTLKILPGFFAGESGVTGQNK